MCIRDRVVMGRMAMCERLLPLVALRYRGGVWCLWVPCCTFSTFKECVVKKNCWENIALTGSVQSIQSITSVSSKCRQLSFPLVHIFWIFRKWKQNDRLQFVTYLILWNGRRVLRGIVLTCMLTTMFCSMFAGRRWRSVYCRRFQ